MKILRKLSRIAVIATVLGVSGLSASDTGGSKTQQPGTITYSFSSKFLKSQLKRHTPNAPKIIGVIGVVAHELGYHDLGLTCMETALYDHIGWSNSEGIVTIPHWRAAMVYGAGNGALRLAINKTECGKKIIKKLQVAPEGWDKTNKLIKEAVIAGVPALVMAGVNAVAEAYFKRTAGLNGNDIYELL